MPCAAYESGDAHSFGAHSDAITSGKYKIPEKLLWW